MLKFMAEVLGLFLDESSVTIRDTLLEIAILPALALSALFAASRRGTLIVLVSHLTKS